MKRRITAGQLMELTPDQRNRLWEWWKPKDFDVHIFGYHNDVGQISNVSKFLGKEYSLPLLDIGQMIELIKSLIHKRCEWITEYGFLAQVVEDNDCEFSETGFCDALWEKAKTML